MNQKRLWEYCMACNNEEGDTTFLGGYVGNDYCFMVTQYGGEWLIVRELLLVNIMQQYLMPDRKTRSIFVFSVLEL